MAKNAVSENVNHTIRWNGKRYSEDSDVPEVTAPTSISAIASGSTINLTVTTSLSSAQILIERSLNGTSGWVEVATKAPGVTTHSDSGLANTTYHYRARHVVDGQYSSYTSNSSATVSVGSGPVSLAVGDLLTINGSGFGTSNATVLAVDFESASVGAGLSTLGFSTSVSTGPNPTNTPPSVSDTSPYSGTRCAVADISTGGNCAAYLTGLNVVELYVSIHLKYVLVSGTPGTVKGVRAHANPAIGGADENLYTAYPGFMAQEPIDPSGNNGHRLQINFGQTSAVSERHIDYGPADIAENTWVRQQYHYRLSNAGVADGWLRYWQGLGVGAGQSSIRNSFMTRASGITDTIYTIMLPFYSDTGGIFYYDNVCIHYCTPGDSGAACRVEIGDSPAYENATKREVMKRESWSDTTVSARLMSHTFGTGTAYAYVIGNGGSVLATQQVNLI